MKTKTSKSIEVVYWITKIGYYIMILGGVALLGFLFALLAGFDMNSVNFTMTLPAKVNFIEPAIFSRSGTYLVRLENFVGTIQFEQFSETPLYIRMVFSLTAIMVYGAGIIIIHYFRLFIQNIYQKQFFHQRNAQYLKYIALAFASLWIFIKVSAILLFFVFSESLLIKNAELTSPYSGGFTGLWMALLMYILAQVFAQGRRIDEENKLTV